MGIRAREKKGYHCHIALIFNERKRTSAWSIAKAVGSCGKMLQGMMEVTLIAMIVGT